MKTLAPTEEKEAGARATPPKRPHVVVVGAGFGGLSAARKLVNGPVDVTLIDRQNHHLFQPLLYQVATAALSPAEIAVPIRSVLRAGKHSDLVVLLDEVIGVDLENRVLRTRNGTEQTYDYLILATGSTYSYFGHQDWARRAPGLKTVEDALDIRHRLLYAFERAETTKDEARRRRLMTFILIGGGPTGVEMAGAVAELAKSTLVDDFDHIDPRSARIILVEAGPRLLSGFPERQGDYARRALEKLGVEVRTGVPVESIRDEGIVLGEETIEAANVVWCAGVQATPVGEWTGARTARNGAVEVESDLSVPGHPEVFVVGDAASCKGKDGKPLPGLAPVAKQQGKHVADVIVRLIRGERPGSFHYRDWGTMATIGRWAAVGNFGNFKVTGFVAWLLWGVVHLGYLVGFRNRLVVLVNWLWALITYGRGARLITHLPRDMSQPQDEEKKKKP